MNNNINKAFKKTSKGNYFGYYRGYSVFTEKMPHSYYRCVIRKKERIVYMEGYHGTYLSNLLKAKRWAKSKIDSLSHKK